jgi:glucosyl-dolichyl phosphate glucuronosyltransferase
MITVILCTYNRSRSLAKALESVAASQLPSRIEWEVLVVDNNSRDQTREVVEGFIRRYPNRFRYLFEPQPGKSYALNSGVRGAKGDILAFIDDDVTVEPRWLQNLTAGLCGKEWAGAGGPIRPEKAFLCPEWLPLHGPSSMGGILALFDRGDTPGELDTPPYGTNMAFRKDIFEKYGDFRTDLGPTPDSEIRNEDTEFGRRIMAGGERLRYEPAAVVYHAVPQSRLSQSYFLRWWFDYGRAEVRETGKRPPILGIPRHYISIPNRIFRHLPKCALVWMRALNPQKRFIRKCWLYRQAGQLVEMCRQARQTKTHSEQYNA